MMFCTDHWARLRAAIGERGLSGLVAQGGEQAAKNLVSEMQDGSTIDNFDPLMAAHNAILSNCMSVAGSRAIEMISGLEECPLCFVNRENPHGFDYDVWIDRAADDALKSWQDLKP